MRIESTNPFTPSAATAGTDSTLAKAATGSGVRETAAAGGFAPTSDLSRLLSLVRAEPEVRADVIAEVMQRSAAGDLSTRQAATDTAAALLDAQ